MVSCIKCDYSVHEVCYGEDIQRVVAESWHCKMCRVPPKTPKMKRSEENGSRNLKRNVSLLSNGDSDAEFNDFMDPINYFEEEKETAEKLHFPDYDRGMIFENSRNVRRCLLPHTTLVNQLQSHASSEIFSFFIDGNTSHSRKGNQKSLEQKMGDLQRLGKLKGKGAVKDPRPKKKKTKSKKKYKRYRKK